MLAEFSATETIYYDTNLIPGTKYTYRFVTIDDAGEAGTAVITATSVPASSSNWAELPK